MNTPERESTRGHAPLPDENAARRLTTGAEAGRPLEGPRKIHDHKVNGLNEAIEVIAIDGRGDGGANHRYTVLFDKNGGPAAISIEFQNGPVRTAADHNGVTNEALLAILVDRMLGFQDGPFRCRENACALTHLEEGMMWLQKRTRDRMGRGVEGTHAR